MKSLSDLEFIEGFSERTAAKLFNSILEGPPDKMAKGVSKIKGQILHPNLTENARRVSKNLCSSVRR